MTLAIPAAATLTVGDLINKVKANLQNRPDVSETQANPEMRPSAWIRDTLRELTANYPFEELRKPGPVVTIGPGLGIQGSNYMYPVSMFLYPGDDVTLMESPVIFYTIVQAQSVGFVGLIGTGNSSGIGYPMPYLTPTAIQSMLFVSGGIPSRYTRYGNQFWFGTQPNTNFNVYLPYQVRHPFLPDLPASPVRVPQEWFDIVGLAAAERGAICLRWNDQANFLHNVLYGDPASQLKDGTLARPGLIAARLFQPERDRRLSSIQVGIVSERY